MKYILYTIGGIFAFALVLILSFGLRFAGIHINGFFSKERAKVERKVFKETRSFTEGMTQQLSKHRLEYLKAKREGDTVTMDILASTIRHQYSDFDSSTLPAQLQQFLDYEINKY